MSRAVRAFIDPPWSAFLCHPSLNGLRRWLGLRPQYQIWSDASTFGYGAHLGPGSAPRASTQGFLLSTCPITREPLSRWRTDTHEAIGVLICLQKWSHILRGSRVRCYVDNAGICEAIANGRGPEHPRHIAQAIRTLAEQEDITLRMCWVPRRENRLADGLSRHFKWDYYFSHKAMRWHVLRVHRDRGDRGVEDLIKRITAAHERVDRVTGWAADRDPTLLSLSSKYPGLNRGSTTATTAPTVTTPWTRRKSDERRMHGLRAFVSRKPGNRSGCVSHSDKR